MESNRKQTKFLSHISTIVLFVAIFAAGFIFGNYILVSEAQTGSRLAINDTDAAFEPFWETYEIIQERFIDPVDVNDLVEGAISGMMEALGDENSVYHNPEAFERTQDISGDYEGIGVQIRQNEDTQEIEVVTVFRGSPAMKAGMQEGDVFISVEGENVVGLTTGELADRVRGPAGTDVQITIRRGEELIDITITRARLEIPNIEYEVLEGNIGYVSLFEFNALSRRQLDEALESIEIDQRDGLIFDLRNNPGGTLGSAIEIGSAFIEEGPIVYEVFGDGTEEIFEANGNYLNLDMPIVVLVNEGSASASELVSGALQDTDTATIIGEVTFGKGTVQTILPLSNGGGVRITIARFLTPDRNWVHKQGVIPDIVIEWDPTTAEDETDPQLQAALDHIQSQSN